MYLQREADGTHESETFRIGDGIVEVPELGRGIILESEGGEGKRQSISVCLWPRPPLLSTSDHSCG